MEKKIERIILKTGYVAGEIAAFLAKEIAKSLRKK